MSPIIQSSNKLKTGLYVHIPFCIHKCAYCDFYSLPNLQLIPDYTNALIKEIQLKANQSLIDTIYFGGGTPSVLTVYEIEKIYHAIYHHFHIYEFPEITLEANPGTLSNDNLSAWKNLGINRINLGIQSFNDKHLHKLGRIYKADQAHDGIHLLLKNGFSNIGFDLIYGIPGQTINDFETDLLTAIQYHPKHLSCYSLTYEPGTPMYQQVKEKKMIPLSEKTVTKMMALLMEIMKDKGFDHYETSNFALCPEFRSKHNQKYWNNQTPYIGLGASAHSYTPYQRSWNVKDIGQYIHLLSLNKDPISGTEKLTREQQMIECILLGLRTKQGIQIDPFEKNFSVCFNEIFSETLTLLESDNYVDKTNDACRLTSTGWFYLDSITDQMVNCLGTTGVALGCYLTPFQG